MAAIRLVACNLVASPVARLLAKAPPLIRVALIIALTMPLVTLLALGGETVQRTAQLHPAIVALSQLLITLTAFVYESLAGTNRRASAKALKEER